MEHGGGWRAASGNSGECQPIVGSCDHLRSRQTNPAARESERTQRSRRTQRRERNPVQPNEPGGVSQRCGTDECAERTDPLSAGPKRTQPRASKRTRRSSIQAKPHRSIQTTHALPFQMNPARGIRTNRAAWASERTRRRRQAGGRALTATIACGRRAAPWRHHGAGRAGLAQVSPALRFQRRCLIHVHVPVHGRPG